MWKREAAVEELIRQLNRYTERSDWSKLTRDERFNLLHKGEWDAVKEQVQWCADDFTWAARNYFWITDNDGKDVLLDLWQAQYLILQLWYDLKSQGRPQKVYIVKGRRVGASVLVEAMIAWSTLFFPNTEALVVSVDQEHSSYLFQIMLHIYDHLPWWLKPEEAGREEKTSLVFDRLDPDQRALKPGLNSKIQVQWATQLSGVGQGRKVLSFHGSELTDWLQSRARRIIEGDLLHAIADTQRAFAFIETTGKEAGSYAHKLWRKCESMAELAEWYPLFIPWFFEPSRKRTVTVDWEPKKKELAVRERVRSEWVKCAKCGRYMNGAVHGVSRIETQCPFCKVGKFIAVVLTDEQLFWKEVKRRNAEGAGGIDQESYKAHLTELASTAEESWQLQGHAVFPPECQERITLTLRDPDKFPGVKVGYFDLTRRFHGLNGARPVLDHNGASTYRCYLNQCQTNHMADLDQFNCIIWEEPQEGFAYSVGVDVAEGIGLDYSVIFVNKFGRFGNPDEQVFTLRDNRIETLDLAYYCDLIGRWYNDALMCIEYEGIGKSTADHVLRTYDYPNVYRWKHLDSVNVLSNKWHWYTKPDTRQKLWQTARKWIKCGAWVIRSKNFLAEMQDFQKDEDDSKSADHSDGGFSDELMAGMISLYAGHEGEADDRGNIGVPIVEDKVGVPRFQMICQSCGKDWPASNPEFNSQCQFCYSHQVIGKPLEIFDNRATVGEVGFNQDGSIVLSSGKGVNYSPDRLTADML